MEIVAKVSNQIKCDRCNALNLPTANFCRDCGAPMAKICICPACQTPGRQGDEFCHHCGHQLPA